MATSHKYKTNEKTRWTYGAELELADWPRNEILPRGMQVDDGAYTNVNSNGVAADGPGKLYHLGGELLTAPSTSVNGPADQFEQIIKLWPETSVNYRMGLNVHIRVPGLRDSVSALKRVQAFVQRVMPSLLPIIDPIPVPRRVDYSVEGFRGAKRCYNTRKKDHHTLVKDWRYELQKKSKTPREFFEAEAIHLPTGKIHWAINPRACVNLRQLMQTDTVEFRHFFMPKTPAELVNATRWCHRFMEEALDASNISPNDLLRQFSFDKREWPKPMEYDSWLDAGWYYTSRSQNKLETVPTRIQEWLKTNRKSKGESICLG